MQQQLTSKQVMDIMRQSQEDIRDIDININQMKSSLEQRLKLIQSIQEYSISQQDDIKELINTGLATGTISNKAILGRQEKVDGTYDTFGSTVHPAIIKTPTDIFNFKTAAGAIFKNNMTVYVNDEIRNDFKNLLMDDSIQGKGIAYEEFDSPDVKITVEINPSDLLGSTDFNTLEILPYLPGSFDFIGMRMYSMQAYKEGNTSYPDFILGNEVKNMGANRFIIDRTRTMYKCDLYFHINFKNTAGRYPLGFKHIYFLKCNFDEDSYMVFKMSRDRYIESISEDIIVYDQNGKYESTCTDEGILLYMNYSDGFGTYLIDTNRGLLENPIARNLKDFYVYMPVDRSITCIEFKNTTFK